MRVFVNDIPLDVREDDDVETVVARYALKVRGLPNFFRINNPDVVIAKDAKIQLESILDELDRIQLDDRETVDALMTRYPMMKRREIGDLYINNYLAVEKTLTSRATPEIIKRLSIFDPNRFTNKNTIEDELRAFAANMDNQLKAIATKLKHGDEIFARLGKLEPVPSTAFILEDVIKVFTLRLPDKENLFDVFDAIEVSYSIPFVMMTIGGATYFKIYKNLRFPDRWVDYLPPSDGIYFKILNASPSKLTSRRITIDSLYSDGRWGVNNVVTLEFKAQNRDEQEMWDKLISVFGGRLRYEVLGARQSSVRGTFTVEGIELNRSIFADIVTNNRDVSYFMFFEERLKTVTAKKMVRAYYSPGHTYEVGRSLALTFTPDPTTKNKLTVRVIHASTARVAERARYVVARLLRIYLNESAAVQATYANLIPGLYEQEAQIKKVKTPKVDKKKGARLAALQKIDPSMFGESSYASQVQKHHQPYIITAEEAKEIAAKYGEHKVMEYEGRWYACEPQTEEKAKRNIWPGLKENVLSLKNPNPEYVKNHPLLPYCYTTDQYTKAASELREYISRGKTQAKPSDEDIRSRKDSGHILGGTRFLDPGRFGGLPYGWERIISSLGFQKVVRGKQTVYPILRYGVPIGSDSFLHCLEQAFSPDYAKATLQGKKDIVAKVRKTLSKMDLAVSRQETFGFTDEELKTILLDPTAYVDPDLFITLAMLHYKCNIFVYVVDLEHPNGEVVIPRYSQAYLPRTIDPSVRSVLIFKYIHGESDYPYQCELMCDVTNAPPKFSFVDDQIVHSAIEILRNANFVSVVTQGGIESY